MRMLRFILFFTVLLFPFHSWAVCSSPAGVEAQILYNSDHKTVQYCDGASWVALGKADLTTALASLTDTNVSPTDGQVLTWDNANSEWIASDTTSGWQVPDDAAVCSGGGITGTIRYNSGKIQVCNNTDWVDVGGAESGGVWSLSGNDISNTNTGNVGVGEPSPTTKLHVAGKTTTDAILLKRQTGLAAPTSTAGWNYSSGNLEFLSGNVGIGTTSPNERLEVGGSSRVFIGDGGGASRKGLLIVGVQGAYTRVDALDYGLSAGRDLALNSSGGNVGIGTTNPQSNLDVAGTIRAVELCDENGNNCNDLSSSTGAGSPVVRMAFYRYSSYGTNTGWLHLKTNQTMNSVMQTVEFKGYAYGESKTIDAQISYYPYSGTGMLVNIGTSGTHPLNVYKSTDDFSVISINTQEYFLGIVLSQYGPGPQGLFPLSITSTAWAVSSSGAF